MASLVKHALKDTELIDLFMGTIQGMYYEKMVDSSSSNFIDVVTIREQIENGLKIGKIASIDNQTVSKRPQGGFLRRRKVRQIP